ncbi:MAG: metallophosphoesterase [Rhodothermales bacterium]
MDTKRIAHLSDLHFGKIAHPGIVDALIEELNGLNPDVVAISGDLTQRAREMEYQAASSMLEAIEPPTIVVPGNHDVYPWWSPLARLLRPLARYRRYISGDASPKLMFDNLAVLGINSAHGRTVKGGRIGTSERQAILDFFGDLPKRTFKVLVVHHHLTQIQALGPHDVARKARKTIERAAEVGVDLVLCGHLHISHIEPIEIVPAEHRLIIASAGTATSSRGRRKHRRINFYNLITVTGDHFTVEERRYDPDEGRFVSDCVTRFERDFD